MQLKYTKKRINMKSNQLYDNWEFKVLLNNLSTQDEIGNEYIKLIPSNSTVLESFINKSKYFRKFINSFCDQRGYKLKPSLIVTNIPDSTTSEQLVDFRNILAISTISKAWNHVLSGHVNLGKLLYSDYFDIYGVSLAKDPEYIIGHTPSISSLDEAVNFKGGQSSEKLAIHSDSKRFVDEYLFNSLMSTWTEHHIQKINNKATTIFRSLEMAYRASSLPFGNQGSINDYGVKLSQWISAFEILAHPKTDHAGLNEVQDLLVSIKFNNNNLNHKIYSYVHGKKRKRYYATSLQKTYYEMYSARNKFLHGEPVKLSDLLINNSKDYHLLTSFAPVIFKFVLQEVLGINKLAIDYALNDVEQIQEYITLYDGESGLSKMRKKKKNRIKKKLN